METGGLNSPPHTVRAEQVQDLPMSLNAYRSMGLDDTHPNVLKGLADVVAEPLYIIFGKLWLSDEVLGDWKKSHVIPIYKKGSKDDPGNSKPVRLTSVPVKIIEQILLDDMLNHMRNEHVI